MRLLYCGWHDPVGNDLTGGSVTLFDPTRFNFVQLEDFRFPGDVSVYEYKNHPAVNGKEDFLRLNLYLTMDNNYVTIWHGLLEPIFTEAECENGRLASVAKPEDFDFRGYVDSDEAAGYIFKALRVGEAQRYLLPQVLSRGTDDKLECDWLQEDAPSRT
jgi:hypothetical protein